MTIEEMKNRKRELGYSNKMISDLSGVPESTVQKIFSGETSSPRYDTIMALESLLSPTDTVTTINEPEPAYNVLSKVAIDDFSGNKTLADFEALPEGVRVELIDGRFYDMGEPASVHEMIISELSFHLQYYIKKNNGACRTFTSHEGVRLDRDDKTIVVPDILVVCDRDKITRKWVEGAPDLIMEVVSPGSAKTDILIKLNKYKNAGVREYWVIFPDDMKVIVYDFENDISPVIYSFDDTIPISIWDGACKIDFKEIYKEIEFIY
ncbi:MAG: Uma2 family endonuclease [Lachnospiraceae bacterium]|nr:Uma2 family endonuclease [Lachnospiraceae bacterium]